MEIARKGDEPPHNVQLIGPEMNTFLRGKAESYRETYEEKMKQTQMRAEEDAKAADVNKEKGAAFLKSLMSENDAIKVTSSNSRV